MQCAVSACSPCSVAVGCPVSGVVTISTVGTPAISASGCVAPAGVSSSSALDVPAASIATIMRRTLSRLAWRHPACCVSRQQRVAPRFSRRARSAPERWDLIDRQWLDQHPWERTQRAGVAVVASTGMPSALEAARADVLVIQGVGVLGLATTAGQARTAPVGVGATGTVGVPLTTGGTDAPDMAAPLGVAAVGSIRTPKAASVVRVRSAAIDVIGAVGAPVVRGVRSSASASTSGPGWSRPAWT